MERVDSKVSCKEVLNKIMEQPISFTTLNDFVFCPASIYFHNLYEGVNNLLYTGVKQIKGKAAHKNIDDDTWSKSDVICSISVYSHTYDLMGKIDKYYPKTKELVESKRTIKTVYDGYVFQLYAQYFAMQDSGYEVEKLTLYSITNNKKYPVKLPCDNKEMLKKFEGNLKAIRNFNLNDFKPTNVEKCQNCIYINACAWGAEF